MKKLVLILLAILFVPLQTLALENGSVLNLKTENSYIIPLNTRPINLQNSNPRAVTVEAVTNIDEADSSLLVTTIEEGIAYISFKQKNKMITIKLLIDNKADEDETLIKLDMPEKPDKQIKAQEPENTENK